MHGNVADDRGRGGDEGGVGEMAGEMPSTETKRVEGTSLSACVQTSREEPARSRDWPRERVVLDAAVTRRAEILDMASVVWGLVLGCVLCEIVDATINYSYFPTPPPTAPTKRASTKTKAAETCLQIT
jgi:hypothetical protein